MNRRATVCSVLLLGLTGCFQTQMRGQAPDEVTKEDPIIKSVKLISDVADVASPASTHISGVGLVYNLEGTGGGNPPGLFKEELEKQLRKNIDNTAQLLNSPDCAMVLVNVLIPPGIRRGDLLDVEVVLPETSRATSLAGGVLHECPLMNYENSKTKLGADQLLFGHVLAKARGPLLVGMGEPDDPERMRRARIWQGAVALKDEPFYLFLKNDQRFASVANMVANRINSAFPNDQQKQLMIEKTKRLWVLDEVTSGINDKFHRPATAGRGEIARAVGRGDIVCVNVPYEYRLNPTRQLLVVGLIPLRQAPEVMAKYRSRLGEMLLDPQETIRTALRLEAMGKESIPTLKKGLASENTLVRFASAEALAYLGNTSGVEELTTLAQKHNILREACLTALGGLNESASLAALTKLLECPIVEVRVAACRNLLALNESLEMNARGPIQGELLNDRFWIHQAAPGAEPLVHLASVRRADVGVFGGTPALVPPFRLGAGSSFSLLAEPGDARCTITHYKLSTGKPYSAQCSLQVADVVKTMARLGGQYPDVFEILRQADRERTLNCPLRIDALPTATPIELLAACGSDAAKFKDQPGRLQEVLAAQEDLGLIVGAGGVGKQ